MKRVKFLTEVRAMTKEQLLSKLDELKASLYGFRVNKKFGKLTQNHLFSSVRADIARIKFVLSEKSE